MTKASPEPFLIAALQKDRSLLSDFAAYWISEYINAGECGLAYDGFVSEIENGNYKPSPDALELVKLAAKTMNLRFPERSV